MQIPLPASSLHQACIVASSKRRQLEGHPRNIATTVYISSDGLIDADASQQGRHVVNKCRVPLFLTFSPRKTRQNRKLRGVSGAECGEAAARTEPSSGRRPASSRHELWKFARFGPRAWPALQFSCTSVESGCHENPSLERFSWDVGMVLMMGFWAREGPNRLSLLLGLAVGETRSSHRRYFVAIRSSIANTHEWHVTQRFVVFVSCKLCFLATAVSRGSSGGSEESRMFMHDTSRRAPSPSSLSGITHLRPRSSPRRVATPCAMAFFSLPDDSASTLPVPFQARSAPIGEKHFALEQLLYLHTPLATAQAPPLLGEFGPWGCACRKLTG